MIQDKQRNENLLQKTNEALITYTGELKRLKKQLLTAVGHSETDEADGQKEKNTNVDSVIKKF